VNEATSNLGDALGAIKGYGGWATSLIVTVLYWWEKRQGRDGDRIKSLFDENEHLRDRLTTIEEKHDRYRRSCEQETAELRADIKKLSDTIAGMHNQMLAQSVAMARAVPLPPSPIMERAMDSVVAELHKLPATGEGK
jgi:predicted  nucleic acid-binding Zn-ribbon protein